MPISKMHGRHSGDAREAGDILHSRLSAERRLWLRVLVEGILDYHRKARPSKMPPHQWRDDKRWPKTRGFRVVAEAAGYDPDWLLERIDGMDVAQLYRPGATLRPKAGARREAA